MKISPNETILRALSAMARKLTYHRLMTPKLEKQYRQASFAVPRLGISMEVESEIPNEDREDNTIPNCSNR